MARTNKYASLNFNDIYEKKIVNGNNNHHNNTTTNNTNNPNNKTKTILPNSRIHGNMLVLTRPTPKPISQPPPPQPQPQPQQPDHTRIESDSISLRPLGRTGSSLSIPPKDILSPKPPEKFVPPHLRPGYVCKEEKPWPEKQAPANRYGEEGRPNSGGGRYDRIRRAGGGGAGGSDLLEINRYASTGNRPSSSG